MSHAAMEQFQEALRELAAKSQQLEERVSRIELRPQKTATDGGQASAGDILARLAEERELSEGRLGVTRAALEAQFQTHASLVQERLGDFQELINTTTSKQVSAHAAIAAIQDELRGEIDRREGYLFKFQERLDGIEKKLEQDLRCEREAAEARFSEVRQLVSFGGTLQQAAQAALAGDEKRLMELRAAMDEGLAGERAQRLELKQALQAQVSRLEQQLRSEENIRGEAVKALRESMRGENATREAHQSMALKGSLQRNCRSTDGGNLSLRQNSNASTEDMLSAISERMEDLERAIELVTALHNQCAGEMSAATSTMPEQKHSMLQRMLDGDAGGGGPRRVIVEPPASPTPREVAPCLSARGPAQPMTMLPPPTALVQRPEAGFLVPVVANGQSTVACPLGNTVPYPMGGSASSVPLSVPGSPRTALPVVHAQSPGRPSRAPSPSCPCAVPARPAPQPQQQPLGVGIFPQHMMPGGYPLASAPALGNPGSPWVPSPPLPLSHFVHTQPNVNSQPGSARAPVVRPPSAGGAGG